MVVVEVRVGIVASSSYVVEETVVDMIVVDTVVVDTVDVDDTIVVDENCSTEVET